jgi:MFS family permease
MRKKSEVTLPQLPPVMRHRDFNLYWFGVVFSQIGSRATIAANLFQVYELTRSTAMTGLVGLAQAVALVALSPLGGAYADRVDRRRLLQGAQAAALLVSAALAALTISGAITAWEIIVSVLLTTAAASFDQPARQALIPAMVPRSELAQAIALLNPSRELAVLTGPALAGVFIALGGSGIVYAFDAATYAVLVGVLAVLRIPHTPTAARSASVWRNITEGASFLSRRPLIWQFIVLDLSATLFGAYSAVLPALTLTVLHAGPAVYGLLSAAPSAGALLATYAVFRVAGRSSRLGRVALYSTAGYGLAVVGLAQSPAIGLAFLAAVLIGGFDAMATTIRQAVVQLETPDEMRGRVTSLYVMASRGGPALGNTWIGWLAGSLGPVAALTLGGFFPVLYSAFWLVRGGRVRDYRGAPEEPADVVSPVPADAHAAVPVEPGQAPDAMPPRSRPATE